MFGKDDGLIYVDVDDAVDDQGELREWAKPFVEPFISRAYIELSPSGRGLHIIGRGQLELAGAGGKANFPQHAAGSKVPEVAIFQHLKYTTITGNIWKGHRTIGDVNEAVRLVWDRAGIKAAGAGAASRPPPDLTDLVTVDMRKVPRVVRDELKDCRTADLEDRSTGRFKLYCDAAQKLSAEEIYSLVVSSDEWFEASGAAAKGAEHTWQDICRAVAKAETAAKEFEAANEKQSEANETAAVAWKELGISVISEMTKSGPVHRAVHGARNMAHVLGRHPEWKGRIRTNLFKERLELDGKELREHDVVNLAEAVRSYLHWDREPNLDLVWKAAVSAGHANAYHPVRDMLCALSWDRVSRIDEWLVRVGCEDTQVARLVGRKWLISLVARALRPGCKVDTVLVLEGPQGRRKSSLFRAIAGGGEFFTDAHVTFDKDGLMVMHGHWIVELAELATFQKAEQLRTKQFISGQDLTFRAPYERVTVTRPRHFLLVGTTNDQEYFTDTTGNRRYWPVRVAAEKLDLEWLTTVREQLLAEAVAAFDAGEPWWFDVDPEALVEAQEKRVQGDALADKVAEFVAEQERQGPERRFTLAHVMERFSIPLTAGKSAEMKLTAALHGLGLERRRETVGGVRAWWWRRPTWLTLVEVPPADARCPASSGPEVGQEVRPDEDLSDVL